MNIAETIANASAALHEGATDPDIANGRLTIAEARRTLAEARAQIQAERDALRLAERDATIADLQEFLTVVRP
ncbi:hypothetical protein [Nocardiopsis synnemataformans]|uniref:hypothetical protein n=1 Tax=Nocardiopsis synnemataformans TaxID=61305 RepID=UPI003EBF80E6